MRTLPVLYDDAKPLAASSEMVCIGAIFRSRTLINTSSRVIGQAPDQGSSEIEHESYGESTPKEPIVPPEHLASSRPTNSTTKQWEGTGPEEWIRRSCWPNPEESKDNTMICERKVLLAARPSLTRNM